MPHLSHLEDVVGGEQEHERDDEQAGHLEHAQQPAAGHDAHGEKREQEAAEQSADLLVGLHGAHDPLLLRPRQRPGPPRSPGTMRGMCWMAPNAAP